MTQEVKTQSLRCTYGGDGDADLVHVRIIIVIAEEGQDALDEELKASQKAQEEAKVQADSAAKTSEAHKEEIEDE